MRSALRMSQLLVGILALAVCLPVHAFIGHVQEPGSSPAAEQLDAADWIVRPGYVVERVATGFRLPVNIAFVPNPGPNPTDPLFYVAERYGSIKVVRNDGTVSNFATGLLDYNPEGPIPGAGDQGLTGIAVDPITGSSRTSLFVSMLWDNGTSDAERGGSALHFPKVERLDSSDGGLTFASRTILRNMQPETQGPSHQVSNISVGPDDKVYVHMGDSFVASTAMNLNQYRGKVLRMNRDGTAAADNPYYSAADGITAADYILTLGHSHPFGGAWRAGDGRHWIVEMGTLVDRLVDLVPGGSYGWRGGDEAMLAFSKYNWLPAVAPLNIDFVEATKFGGSGFPAEAMGHAFVSLAGPTYAEGPQERAKSIEEFPDLDSLDGTGKLAVSPSTLVKYNGAGRATIAALAVGPDGIYFSDLYEDTGAYGPTAPGANVYRVRYVGTTGGQPPTIVSAASATPNPVTGTTTTLRVLGADDGGEVSLTYTWGVQGTPPAPVTFNTNGTNAAKKVVATFAEAGVYNFFVTIRDAGGQTAVSNVTVSVNSTYTSLIVSPATAILAPGAAQQFTATAHDQFGGRLMLLPPITWSATRGTISGSGLYTAPATTGTFAVTAAAAGRTGSATAIVEHPGDGLTARYYDTVTLTDRPVTRVDPTIDFDWGVGSPSPNIEPDTFSSRWEGRILPRFSETYTFFTTSDDGVRLWINNRRIINQWNDRGFTVHSGTIALTAGVKVNIVLEHREQTGEAVSRLEWESASQPRQIVPREQLFSTWRLNVNFQPAGAPVPAGYVADTGTAFGRRGNGWSYGWNGDNTAAASDRDNRGSPDQRYDTLVHMQERLLPDAFWELAVPDGSYTVRIVSGDPDGFNGIYRIDVEGVLAIDAAPTSRQRWFEATVTVGVTDGRLTISNAAGAVNNKINFVDITQNRLAIPVPPPQLPNAALAKRVEGPMGGM